MTKDHASKETKYQKTEKPIREVSTEVDQQLEVPPSMLRLTPASILHLQRTIGNQAVQRLLQTNIGETDMSQHTVDAVPIVLVNKNHPAKLETNVSPEQSKKFSEGFEVTEPSRAERFRIRPTNNPVSTLQMRGFRPPSRPPRPPRGRHGQLPGQNLPRNSRNLGREAFQRREQARVASARRRFEEEIKRTQEKIERWAKEGSEPKTPRERAIRAILKLWEVWDDLSTSWDKTHGSFNMLLEKRVNMQEQISKKPKRIREQIDTGIVQVWNDLQQFDLEFAERVTEWETRFRGWQSNLGNISLVSLGQPIQIVMVFVRLVILLSNLASTMKELKNRLDAIDHNIGLIQMQTSEPREWIPSGPKVEPVD